VNAEPVRSVCILRLSALGDVTHVVPLVRTLQAKLPQAALTWIVGKVEAKLVGDLPGVEFVVIDKRSLGSAAATLRERLRGRRFDALLHCQVALRANLVSALVPARRRVGYDRARAKDGHGLFVRERIPARTGQHVLDAIGSFAEPLGLVQDEVRWDIPIPDEAHDFARRALPGEQPTLLISAASSHALRNWLPERYAAVADHAVRAHGMRVALCGGRDPAERALADAIVANMQARPVDLVGKDTLKQFLALCRRARLVLAPDSGPLHMANAVGARVIGLHAASNPRRSGAYSNLAYAVDRYDAAARKFRGKPAAELKWGTKLEFPGVMDLVDAESVVAMLDRALA
jgi:heptosyltransferase I